MYPPSHTCYEREAKEEQENKNQNERESNGEGGNAGEQGWTNFTGEGPD
jgi:hypothetical protein